MTARSISRPVASPFARSIVGRLAPFTWTPAALFAQGQQGVWYEPRPEYLYQDSAGTTPVTADGQPVGLMLDRSKGLELGPELVTNGTFDSDVSGWSAHDGALLSNSSGMLSVDPNGSGVANANQELTNLVPGRSYEFKFDLARGDAVDETRVYIAGNTSYGGTHGSISTVSDGSYSLIFVPNSSTEYVLLRPDISGAGSCSFDNISVRELKGNHATQTTAANKPLYRTDGTLRRLEGDGVDDEIRIPWFQEANEDQLLVFGFEQISSSTNAYLFGASSDNGVGLILNSGVLRPYVKTLSGSAAFNGQTLTNGVAVVVSVEWDRSAGELRMYVNGSLSGQVSATPDDLLIGAEHALFNRGLSGGYNYNAKVFYATGVSGDLSGRAKAEEYAASLAGVTL